jgi:hypothetical protein
MLPYTTGQKKLKGIVYLDDPLSSAVSADAVKLAARQAAAVLREIRPANYRGSGRNNSNRRTREKPIARRRRA